MEGAETSRELTSEPARGFEFLLIAIVAMTAWADFCLWRDKPRLSVGLFAIGAIGIILASRPGIRWTRRLIWMAALLCAAAVESAIALCFSNVLVLLALTLALAGETFYQSLRGGWNRWSEIVWSILKISGRWLWLLREIKERTQNAHPSSDGYLEKILRTVWIVVPGLLVTLFFAAIFWNGNALFAKFAATWSVSVTDWLLALHISAPRCVFWTFVAGMSLPLLRPSSAPGEDRIWTKEIPLIPELTTAGTARMQAAVTLGLLNALFCCVNTIDVVYLWARQKLPPDVSYSAFVHRGVESLIMATLFSAVLLAGMFHQSKAISGWLPLRLLGLLWIGQNLMLLAGVFLRVKLYLDAFDLTVTRLSLAFFLVLVAVGFVLLSIHVARQRTLGWLLHANMLASFFLFYAVQFLDTQGFVARYNVRLWQNAHRTRALDISYSSNSVRRPSSPSKKWQNPGLAGMRSRQRLF